MAIVTSRRPIGCGATAPVGGMDMSSISITFSEESVCAAFLHGGNSEHENNAAIDNVRKRWFIELPQCSFAARPEMNYITGQSSVSNDFI